MGVNSLKQTINLEGINVILTDAETGQIGYESIAVANSRPFVSNRQH